jgi:hypothetical protein
LRGPIAESEDDVSPRGMKRRARGRVPTLDHGGRVTFGLDILLAFPSPLPVATFPDYSAGNVYQAAELFNYSTSRLALDTRLIRSTSAEVSWTRVG